MNTRKDVIFWSIWAICIILAILGIIFDIKARELIQFSIVVLFSILIIIEINSTKFRNWINTKI